MDINRYDKVDQRVLAAVLELHCRGERTASISAIRRIDGELCQAAPMGLHTAFEAAERLWDHHELMAEIVGGQQVYRLPRQRRRCWTNSKSRAGVS